MAFAISLANVKHTMKSTKPDMSAHCTEVIDKPHHFIAETLPAMASSVLRQEKPRGKFFLG